MHTAANRVVVVMGVSGTGKSTVGRLLAEQLGVPYAEADDFHPPANITKMSAGIPLDDDDRRPWLDAIAEWARERDGDGGVVSCSALKRRYRDRLRLGNPGLFFLHLHGTPELIAARLQGRKGHFMPPELLKSQLEALEPLEDDEDGTTLDVTAEPSAITSEALTALGRPRRTQT